MSETSTYSSSYSSYFNSEMPRYISLHLALERLSFLPNLFAPSLWSSAAILGKGFAIVLYKLYLSILLYTHIYSDIIYIYKIIFKQFKHLLEALLETSRNLRKDLILTCASGSAAALRTFRGPHRAGRGALGLARAVEQEAGLAPGITCFFQRTSTDNTEQLYCNNRWIQVTFKLHI